MQKARIEQRNCSESHRLAIAPLLDDKWIEPYFQSIISVRREEILGVEALARIIDSDNHALLPRDLLRQATEAGLTRDLDHVCLESALGRFGPTHRELPERIVFLNAHAATLTGGDRADSGLSLFVDLAEKYGIDPRNIVIELLETAYEDLGRLQDVVARCQQHGFLVALDDIGVGYSNLDRLVTIHPDLIKTDRSLARNICSDYYRQEVFRALLQVSEKIGGWIVAEGVESEEDALCLLGLGGDLLQGYYFERPMPWSAPTNEKDPPIQQRIRSVAETFKRETTIHMREVRLRRENRHRVAREIIAQIEDVPAEQREATIAQVIRAYPDIVESAALIDETGIQSTDTYTNPRAQLREKTIIYPPAHQGAKHALKEYFYAVMEAGIPPGEIFETDPYVPLPSGDLCVTATVRFVSRADGSHHILCLHMQA